MKTMKLIFAGCLFFTISVGQAQIKVASSGAAGVGLATGTTPVSTLAIGGAGSTESKVYIAGANNGTGLNVYRSGSSGYTWSYGISSITDPVGAFNVGIKGQCFPSSPVSGVGSSYGIYGIAGNGQSGKNYGVYGVLGGNISGAGVVGTVGTYTEPTISGYYAGYFVGNVLSTGSMYAPAFIVNSDKRYKDNITTIDQPKSLKGILDLNPVEYNLKQFYTKGRKDSVEVDVPYYDEKSQLFTKKHYGLLAQEIQAIYPDLVYEKEDGYLAVDYIGLIPVLIQSVKELSAKVDALSPKQPAKTKSAVLNETSTLNLPCVLYQNSPNPFTVSTTIKYSLSNDITSAEILIFDMQGKLIRTEPIAPTGNGSIIVEGSSLAPGMYIYTLIANGNEIDTKRMVLTK